MLLGVSQFAKALLLLQHPSSARRASCKKGFTKDGRSADAVGQRNLSRGGLGS